MSEHKNKDKVCSLCGASMEEGGQATQVYRRSGSVITVTGIPAVRVCPRCQNAVLEWEIAGQVEDLVRPLFGWIESHSMPKPVITVVFPSGEVAA
jgi:YgiT-type zinc finger domain-containing protein